MAELFAYTNTKCGDPGTGCSYCLDPQETTDLICFTDLWRVRLHPKQAHIGACIVYTARHAQRVSELSSEEFSEFQTVMVQLEQSLVKAFGTVLLNYSCWMNYAFREDDPNPPYQNGKPSPHVHWQIHPRYDKPVDLDGCRFEDPTFGAPYVTGRDQTVDTTTRNTIRTSIVEGLDVVLLKS